MAQTPCKSFKEGDILDHTPVSAIAQGDVVILGNGLVGIAVKDIAANTTGSIAIRGGFWCPKVTGQIAAFAQVYWDADADPLGGTAGSGAVTTTAAGNTALGHALLLAADTSQEVLVLLTENRPVAAVVAPLTQTTNGSYQQAQVQAIADKVDAVIAALKNAGLMATA